METIEEAKKRLETTLDGQNGFYRGVLWANRWIEPETELPEHLEAVLIRRQAPYEHPLVGRYDNIESRWYVYADGYWRTVKRPIEWRPIERK